MTAEVPQGPVNISAAGAGSVAAKEINGPVHIGDVVLHAERYLPPAAVTAPSGTNNLPQPRSSLFVGRERELRRLRDAVESRESAVVAQTMHGLGGVGKTALALQYANTYRGNYDVVWWISADSPDSITAGLAALGFRLNPRLGVSGATSTESSEWAVAWLQCHAGWLLILDNVEDPQLVSPLVGQTQNGHHLITSRVSVGWQAIGTQLGLDVLSSADAVELLTRMSAVADESMEKEAVALEVGCLPLALEHAAAYVHYNKVPFGRYLELLRRVPEKALSFMPAIGATSVSVTKTWQVTLQAIQERDDLAIEVLRFLAWLGPDDIPRELLYALTEEAFEVDSALGLLSAYSMISLTRDSVSVHRLVQAVTRASETASTDSPSHPHVRASLAILENLNLEPEISSDSWPMWRRMVPHIESLSRFASIREASGATRTVLYYAARFLKSQSQLAPALECADKCVKMAECDLDDDSDGPDYLSCMNILGAILQELGQHEKSVRIFNDLVERSIGERGSLDFFTLSMKNNLASAYQDAGDISKAIAIFEQTLKEREEVLPFGDPVTATTRHNLAIAHRINGNPHLSVPILERVVKDREALYGRKGIGTLNSMFNLAISYTETGDLVRAMRLLKHVLNERREIFGPDGRHVIGARGVLADVYRKAGNNKRSIPLYEENLQSAIRAYGADSWQAVERGMPLAFAYQDVKEPQKAIPLLQRVVMWQESAKGETDRFTLMARNNLATAYWLHGDNKSASSIFERALSISAEVLGVDDKVTRTIRMNFQNLKVGIPIRGVSQFDIRPLDFRA
ncbi:FxSxx-COOH system tetratricopeptide repeat protein [Streptomyces cyaneofuscatus]|uniref:FxSxx-COOH system tetratricopeptide repeat protein n=1 Tax=Streptomyces cyaneofuscatus TaxID=66883 RepID=UPI0036AFB002